MSEQLKVQCPECDDSVGRRDFLMTVGGTAVTLAGLEAVPSLTLAQPARVAVQPARAPRPAEALIRELYESLSPGQRYMVVHPWNHGAGNNQTPTRKRMYNAAIFGNFTIGTAYKPSQQELTKKILRSICSDDEGFRRITRNNTFDGSGAFERCGAYIFGDPTNNQQYSWVFTGHHLTVRCDGNSEPNSAFGGPMYYGHSPDGHSQRNVFNFQTRSVLAVWDALTPAQRRSATMAQYVTPREQEGSIRFRREGFPGVAYRDLTPDQRRLIDNVMRDLISPYRREDGDEVMDLIRRNGGMDRIHLGFYRDAGTAEGQWDFWRLEGPGFVWNYRVLPHVHCFVNIALQQPAAQPRRDS